MHHHDHHYPPSKSNQAFLIGAGLNIIYVSVEATFGFLTNSLSLLADAGHNLSDVLVLLLAWGANHLATLKPTDKHTYGYRRATILAALFSGIILFLTMGFIGIESIQRLFNAAEVDSIIIMIVAGAGIIINAATAALFFKDQAHDLNVKGAYLHMVADALVSVAVVLGGLIIYFTDWLLVDPLLGLIIIGVIAISAWGLLRDSFNLALDAVPENIDLPAIKQYLLSIPDVEAIHDLHVWGMSTTDVALTAHLLCDTDKVDDKILQEISTELEKRFNVSHSTIQIENGRCDLECQH